MANTIVRMQTRLLKHYYKYFSKYAKGESPLQKVAWVTAFTPVEILEALGVAYYYPESYAAVIAASEKEQEMFAESDKDYLSRDCCSYSCCFNGCLNTEEGPRGVPPKPDILIATNNQCNTLPNWWNVLAERYSVPLIVLDYPGENTDREAAMVYVTSQHKKLISAMEEMTGNTMDYDMLGRLIENSKNSVKAWNAVISYLPKKNITPTALFDDINFLITARCKQETAEMYLMMADAMSQKEDSTTGVPVFWLGYPLWYHPDRYLSELMGDYRIVGSNYLTWWSLDYSGEDVYERLFSAYNYTFLNLTQKSRDSKLLELIKQSGAKGAVVLHNKSCKCDFVSAINLDLPQAEIEIDMIDRNYVDMNKASYQINLLKEMACAE